MRGLEAVRAGYGLCQLAFPTLIFRALLRRRPGPRVTSVMRILGARHLLQAVVLGAAPTSRLLHVGGGVVDALHSASMVLLAVTDRRRRGEAVLDSVVAGLFAGAEFSRGGPR